MRINNDFAHHDSANATIEALAIVRGVREEKGNWTTKGADDKCGMLACTILANTANGGNCQDIADGFLHALASEHRHLQSLVISTLFTVLRAYGEATAKEPGMLTDGRNEHVARQCQSILDVIY